MSNVIDVIQYLGRNYSQRAARFNPGTLDFHYISYISISKKEFFLSNYNNDNVPYAFGSAIEEVKENLNQDCLKLSEWLYKNCTILNPDKSRPQEIGHKTSATIFWKLQTAKLQTIVGVEIDKKLNFKSHIETVCTKASHYKESQTLQTRKRKIFSSIQ